MDPVEVRELDSCFDSTGAPRAGGRGGTRRGVARREGQPQGEAQRERRGPASIADSRSCALTHVLSPRALIPESTPIPLTAHLTLLVESGR